MNLKFLSISLLIIFVVLSCKNSEFSDYKYTDKPVIFTCDGVNNPLLKEAVYSFEDDITKFYGDDDGPNAIKDSYYEVFESVRSGDFPVDIVLSEHSLEIFEALKKEAYLWDFKNTQSHLDYKSSLMNCIANTIKDNSAKTTFKALLSTNSLKPKLIAPILQDKAESLLKDKYLALYVALEMFYSPMYDVDFSRITLGEEDLGDNVEGYNYGEDEGIETNENGDGDELIEEVDEHADHNH